MSPGAPPDPTHGAADDLLAHDPRAPVGDAAPEPPGAHSGVTRRGLVADRQVEPRAAHPDAEPLDPALEERDLEVEERDLEVEERASREPEGEGPDAHDARDEEPHAHDVGDEASEADDSGTADLAPAADAPTARRSRAMRLTKDLDLLRGLATDSTGEGIGVVRLATQIGRDKSQVSRSLRALVETGLVERDAATGRYHLGLELYALAAATAQRRLLSVAPDVLRHLAGELDETVHLCTLHGIDVLTLRSESPPARATAWGAWEGETVPAHATSAGRVLLAGLSPAALRDRYRAAELAGAAPRSRVQGVQDLAAVLSEVRASGTSIVTEEHEEGAVGVSAPVHDFRGERVAAINVSGERRLMEPRLDVVVERVSVAAVSLSRLLGARTTADGALPRRPT